MRYVLKRENYKSERQDYLAAIDLGSNTCRLLVARPQGTGYKVVDSFSRVIRLGLGIKNSGVLLDESMQRAIDALKQCATKLQKYDIASFRAVATEARSNKLGTSRLSFFIRFVLTRCAPTLATPHRVIQDRQKISHAGDQ